MEETLLDLGTFIGGLVLLAGITFITLKIVIEVITRRPSVQYISRGIKFRVWFGCWPQEISQARSKTHLVLAKFATRYLFYAVLEPHVMEVRNKLGPGSDLVRETFVHVADKEWDRVKRELEHRKKAFWKRHNLARDFCFEVEPSAWDYIQELKAPAQDR